MSIIHLHDVKVTMITNKTVSFSFSYLDMTLFDIYSLKFASIMGATTAGAALNHHGSPCQSQNVV
jgi:hypothetical protein